VTDPSGARDFPLVADSPWVGEDVLRWSMTTLVGIGLTIAAWFGADDHKVFHQQYGWTALAVVGAVIAFSANAMWITRGRSRLGRRTRAVLGEIEERDISAGALLSLANAMVESPSFVATVNGTRFHRPACPLVKSRTTVTGDREMHLISGRRECGICRP
jgi:hypothetical protein